MDLDRCANCGKPMMVAVEVRIDNKTAKICDICYNSIEV